MKKYEYKFFYECWLPTDEEGRNLVIKWLNGKGAKGWRVVAMMNTTSGSGLMMREIPEEKHDPMAPRWKPG